MRRRAVVTALLAVACRPEPAPAPSTVTAAAPSPAPAPAPAADPAPRAANVPSLVVHNPSGTGIEIDAAWVVDASGELGTRLLWPRGDACPGVPKPPQLIAGGGRLVLPPPTEAYAPGSCTPTPLRAGDHVVRLSSGFGETLYAAADVTLPLTAPAELEMKVRDPGPPCDPIRARRAARLALAAAEADGSLPPEFPSECDVERATCSTLPIESELPPPVCTITLRERLLRIEGAAGDDAPRWLDAWADPEVVYVQRPKITRTSASRIDVDGEPVVFAGVTDHQIHTHGGDPAQIGGATFVVHNPHARALPLRVRSVEFLRSFSCGLPQEVTARPKPAPGSPTSLAPGQSTITIGFESQPAYNAHCDRFATRVTFDVKGKRIAATVEHEVTREEPLDVH